MSLCIGSSLDSTFFQPNASGQRFTLLSTLELDKKTRRPWYLAADEVGGRCSGCTKVVVVATF